MPYAFTAEIKITQSAKNTQSQVQLFLVHRTQASTRKGYINSAARISETLRESWGMGEILLQTQATGARTKNSIALRSTCVLEIA
jgi:hypothetical protein